MHITFSNVKVADISLNENVKVSSYEFIVNQVYTFSEEHYVTIWKQYKNKKNRKKNDTR